MNPTDPARNMTRNPMPPVYYRPTLAARLAALAVAAATIATLAALI